MAEPDRSRPGALGALAAAPAAPQRPAQRTERTPASCPPPASRTRPRLTPRALGLWEGSEWEAASGLAPARRPPSPRPSAPRGRGLCVKWPSREVIGWLLLGGDTRPARRGAAPGSPVPRPRARSPPLPPGPPAWTQWARGGAARGGAGAAGPRVPAVPGILPEPTGARGAPTRGLVSVANFSQWSRRGRCEPVRCLRRAAGLPEAGTAVRL